ncbi:hypothetical protein GQ457_13G015060 [Hibiscus cannabinus]
MGSHGHKQNKIFLDVAADSLSFTSLVCIDPNQHSKFLPGRSSSPPHQTDEHHDHEFEFTIPHNSNKKSPPDMKSRLPMVSQKTSEDAKNEGQREANGSKSWFGRKLFNHLPPHAGNVVLLSQTLPLLSRWKNQPWVLDLE